MRFGPPPSTPRRPAVPNSRRAPKRSSSAAVSFFATRARTSAAVAESGSSSAHFAAAADSSAAFMRHLPQSDFEIVVGAGLLVTRPVLRLVLGQLHRHVDVGDHLRAPERAEVAPVARVHVEDLLQ